MKWIWLLLLGCCCWGEGRAQDLEDLSYEELDSLADFEYKKGDYTKSILFKIESRCRYKREFNVIDSIYAEYTTDLAFFHHKAGQYKESEELFLEGQKMWSSLFDKNKHSSYAICILNLATLYMDIESFSKAEKLFLEAKDILILLGKNDPLYATSLNNLALLYKNTSRFSKAEKLYIESKEIRAKILGREHLSYATSLDNLASLYYIMGSYHQAEPLFLQSKDIRSKVLGKEHPRYATSLNNLGLLYKDMNNYGQAEPLLLESMNILEKVLGKGHPMYTLSLSNLALLYQGLGKLKQSEELYIESKKFIINKFGKKNFNYIRTLGNLASLYHSMKNFEKAESLFIEAIELWDVLGEKENLSYTGSLNNLAGLYRNIGSYHKAELLFFKAKSIYAKILGKENPSYAKVLHNLADLYLEMNNLDSAFVYCMASIDANSAQIDNDFWDIEILDKIDYYSYETINASLHTLLKIVKSQFNASGNKFLLEEHFRISQIAMHFNEKVRNNFNHKIDKLITLYKNNYFIFQGIAAALLFEKYSYKKEAFSFAEQNKSILLREAIKGNLIMQFGNLPDILVERELQLQKQLSALEKQQYTVKTSEGKAEMKRVLGELNLSIDTFLKSLKDQYPKYYALKYENITAKAEEIQDLLDEETLLLEYFQADSILYLFAVNKDSVEIYPIRISKAIINKKVGKLRKSLSDYFFILEDEDKAYQEYTKTAHWFYKELLAVALKDKSIKNLIIIADGELGHLPFEAFLTKPVPTKKAYKDLPYFINKYKVSYNYSATLWKDNLKAKNRTSNGQMLACAATYEVSLDSSFWNIRLPYYFSLRRDSSLSPLFANKEEISILSNNFYGKFLIGEPANERFFKENASNYSIIHLAMHGLANMHTPMLSSLAFTEDGDSVENNFLQAYEISQMKLNADLVVLSACETGYGKFRQGEGIASLARAFMYAGAPSLVVSLWQINDVSTAIIMQSFYEYLGQGKTKSGALRQAKLDYLKGAEGIKAHPAFWSAFIQLGNDAPIELQRKLFVVRYKVEIIWGVIMSLLLLGYVYKRRQKKQLV